MKSKTYTIIFISVLMFSCYSCEKNIINNNNISGKLIHNTDCKTFKSAKIDSALSGTLSCIIYSFDASTNKLILKHMNAGFNCCPEELYCTISVNNDTIIIQELEKKALCNCNCLYDLDIELNGVESKNYYIKIMEPYAIDEEKLSFGLDLEHSNEGSYCVTRKHYPWGIYK
jgi:hypothetical protein